MVKDERQKFQGCKTVKVRQGYEGEVKNGLREGYGVYTYPNSFFRYEGEWAQGLKQGFGRFKMRDGSYYEGQFVDGEIQGEGRRFWAHSGNSYEGAFNQGELMGPGRMVYGDGSVYQGDWIENKREGSGELVEANRNYYKGSFYHNRKHGDGKQIYSNGDEYEGSWIKGNQQGHGLMKFADGSIYEGQWRGGKMSGEGSLVHSSSISYSGMWWNGRPSLEPVKIKTDMDDGIVMEQSEVMFSLNVQCMTSDDEVTTESGRLLRVRAGIRVSETKTKSITKLVVSTNETIHSSVVDNKERITTPFGFDVEIYPITSQQIILNSIETRQETSSAFEDIKEESIEESSMATSPDQNNTPVDLVACYNNEAVHSPIIEENTKTPIKSQTMLPATNILEEASTVETPIIQSTVNGRCEFANIVLPSVTNMANQSVMSLSPDTVEGKLLNRNRRSTDASNTKLLDSRDKKRLEETALGGSGGKNERENSGRKKKSQKGRDNKADESSLEKYCKAGEYVIMIEDVTEQPFLDIKLPATFIHVSVIAPSRRRSRSVK